MACKREENKEQNRRKRGKKCFSFRIEYLFFNKELNYLKVFTTSSQVNPFKNIFCYFWNSQCSQSTPKMLKVE